MTAIYSSGAGRLGVSTERCGGLPGRCEPSPGRPKPQSSPDGTPWLPSWGSRPRIPICGLFRVRSSCARLDDHL